MADGPAPVVLPAASAMRARRSQSKVTDAAPSDAELLEFVRSAATVADHSSLKPWRVIALRGDDRTRMGAAYAKADGKKGSDVAKKARGFERAPLVLALVVSPKKGKPEWEQEATAAGVAHHLSLVLDEAGWGVFWRTGSQTRAKGVAKAHGLKKNERLLGWLYVGGKPPRTPRPRRLLDPEKFVSSL